jgi:mRNA interferase MazF
MMSKFEFGDIILLKFPFTDGKKAKKRPALVINDFLDGDIIVCRITSQIYSSKQDVFIENWESTDLKLTCNSLVVSISCGFLDGLKFLSLPLILI